MNSTIVVQGVFLRKCHVVSNRCWSASVDM